MTGHFPSTGSLTWQEWRASTYGMDSTSNLTNGVPDSRSAEDGAPRTLANYITEDHPFYIGRHSMVAPHLPVGSPERSALFAELRRTFCEDWAAAEESLQREREVAFGDLYFVAAGNAIKIGRTTNFAARLRFIQGHNHEETKCLLLLKGQGWREKEFHKRFRIHRLRGEWFKRCAEIEAEIDHLMLVFRHCCGFVL